TEVEAAAEAVDVATGVPLNLNGVSPGKRKKTPTTIIASTMAIPVCNVVISEDYNPISLAFSTTSRKRRSFSAREGGSTASWSGLVTASKSASGGGGTSDSFSRGSIGADSGTWSARRKC